MGQGALGQLKVRILIRICGQSGQGMYTHHEIMMYWELEVKLVECSSVPPKKFFLVTLKREHIAPSFYGRAIIQCEILSLVFWGNSKWGF